MEAAKQDVIDELRIKVCGLGTRSADPTCAAGACFRPLMHARVAPPGGAVGGACTHDGDVPLCTACLQLRPRMEALAKKGQLKADTPQELEEHLNKAIANAMAERGGSKVCWGWFWSASSWASLRKPSTPRHATSHPRNPPWPPLPLLTTRLPPHTRTHTQGVLQFEKKARDLDRQINSAEQEAGGNKEELKQSLRKVRGNRRAAGCCC